MREKYRISDEEGYSEQLNFFLAGGILKAVAGDTEGMVNDFINKIANKKISKEVAEYNKNKEMMTVMTIQMAMALKGFFGEMSEKEITKLEKLTKKLEDTEMFKRIMENSEKLENNDNLNSKKQLKKVRIVKSGYGDEDLLKDFYDYLKAKDIQEVFGVEEADLIISLGGDGTMLVAAKEAILRNIPILAINMGSLGYLAEVKPQNAVKMLQDYENGNYKTEERAFLEVKYEDNVFYALNELVITKGGHEAHLIQVEVYSNDIFVNKYRADGIIVATPTGSTAYSLSAGGSIVHPGLNALSITPLAPQSLTARPIIVNGCEVLSFKATSRDDAVHLNIDGNQWFQIQENDLVTARLSKKKIRIIKPINSDYYSILRQKLKWGDSVL